MMESKSKDDDDEKLGEHDKEKLGEHDDEEKAEKKKEHYKKIMFNYNQFIIDDFYRMSFQNVFHYKNMNISNLYGAWKDKILN